MLSILVIATQLCSIAVQSLPVIGIPGMRIPDESTAPLYTVDQTQIHYIEAIEKAGGIPLTLPVLKDVSDPTILAGQLELVDGIIIQGGLDVTPSLYNEEATGLLGQTDLQTDTFLVELIKLATVNKIPILGICRGLQILNVAFGGSLYQDFTYRGLANEAHQGDATKGCDWKHTVSIKSGSYLAKLFPANTTLYVNSYHHQSIKALADGFEVDGTSDDGVIEVFHRNTSDHYVFGVQFHPEQHLRCNDDFLPIFTSLVNEAQLFKVKSESENKSSNKAPGWSIALMVVFGTLMLVALVILIIILIRTSAYLCGSKTSSQEMSQVSSASMV